MDRCASWLCALCSNCDESGLCLVDDEDAESIKWTVAVLILVAALVVEGAELGETFECSDSSVCLHSSRCVWSFLSWPSRVDGNDDDGDDSVGDGIVDVGVSIGSFLYRSGNSLMQTLDVDGAHVGPARISS